MTSGLLKFSTHLCGHLGELLIECIRYVVRRICGYNQHRFAHFRQLNRQAGTEK